MHRAHEWFRRVSNDIEADYRRLHEAASKDPQKAGHGGETTWESLLRDWLPASYGLGTRKYILPEKTGEQEAFETDLVVFCPGYPERLQAREEVLAGGVAAAFSVKLALDAAGLEDGVRRASLLRRCLQREEHSLRDSLLGAFPFGLLAHSHVWKQPASTPTENVDQNWAKEDADLVSHPRECLDFVCVADLGHWTMHRSVTLPPASFKFYPHASEQHQRDGFCTTQPALANSEQASPVGTLIAKLIGRLAYTDASLQPIERGFSAIGIGREGGWGGRTRWWDLDHVLPESVRAEIAARACRGDPNWQMIYF